MQAGGRQNPCWLAPRRPEFGSSATSSSLDVLSQAADPTSLKSLRGLCHQVRPTTRSPQTHTHTHSRPRTHSHSLTHTRTFSHTHSHIHIHTADLLDICSEESRDVGVGEDSHVVSQELEHLKRKSGRGWGVCSPGKGLSKGFIAFEHLTRHFFFIKICNLWLFFFPV